MALPTEDHNIARPPLALTTPGHQGAEFEFGDDPSRYLAKPEQMFERPWLSVPGVRAYIWPLGIEGFGYSGKADFVIHKYLGDNEIDVSVIHRDEPTFELSGLLPGNTSVKNMLALIEIFRAPTPERGKILNLPFIVPQIQFVIPTSYRFRHEEDDRTRSLAYSLEFLRIGSSSKKGGTGAGNVDPTANPTTSSGPKGEPARQHTVADGTRTLKQIAKKVYNDVDKWTKLFNLNEKKLTKAGITRQEAATHKLPIGMKIAY